MRFGRLVVVVKGKIVRKVSNAELSMGPSREKKVCRVVDVEVCEQ